MDPSTYDNSELSKEISESVGKKIFLHINPKIAQNDSIKSKIIPIVNKFCEEHEEYSVVVGADQYSEEQEMAFNDIQGVLSAKNIIHSKYDDPLALCKVLDCCDVIVTHKLHVGIVGAQLGKSVISFSGHTSKIERLYDQLNESGRSISLKQVTLEQGLEMMNKYHQIPIQVPSQIRESAKINFQKLTEFIEQYM